MATSVPTSGDIVDRLEIRELLENWVVWRDAGDWERFATVWHDDGCMVATWFQASATESYRYELAPFGIDATIIEPGTFPTPIATKRQAATDSERVARYQSAIDDFGAEFYAENRSATPPNPQEVAYAVAHLVALPAGERPLRTVVATPLQRQAPQMLNEAATQATPSFFEALHIPQASLKFERKGAT